MAIIASTILQLSNPFFPNAHKSHAPLHLPKFRHHSTVRANTEDSDNSATDTSAPTEPSEPDSFESRLSQVRLRYRSGTGKKAEARKGRKSKKGSSSGAGIYLPPVPLKEPVSGGMKVDLGFSPYSERINGRIAILGLSALLLVELATGKSVINYHSPAIVFIQLYFVVAVSVLYVKYEKEGISIWPPSSPAAK